MLWVEKLFQERLKHKSSITLPPSEPLLLFDNYSTLDIFILGLSQEDKEEGFELSSVN